MRVAITGTPGTGKSGISKELAHLLKYKYIDLNDYAERAGFVTGVDKKRNSKIVDTRKLSRVEFADDSVIDGHLSHFCSVDYVVVLRTKPDELRRRLEKKGWTKPKIDENVEAELIGVCSVEARERHEAVVDLDTTALEPQSAAKIIAGLLKSRRFKGAPIDWLEISEI